MFAGHRAAKLDRHQVQRFGKRIRRLQIIRFVRPQQDNKVEVTISDMADNRRYKSGIVDLHAGTADGGGKLVDRHAAIGDISLGPGAERLGSVIGIMPRLPQAIAILGPCGPFKARSAIFLGDGREQLNLFGDTALAAMEFKEQMRRFGKVHIGIVDVHAAHLHLVQELDPRHRQSRLHRIHHRIHRTVDRVESTGRRQYRFGLAEQAYGHTGDQAQRSLRTDEQMRQVISGRGFARPCASLDYLTVRQHHLERHDILAHRAVAHGIGSRGTGRRHPADRGVGARINGEHQPGGAQFGIQLFARHAGLDRRQKIALVDLEDPVHAAEINADTAIHRNDMAFQRGAYPVRDNGTAGTGTDAGDGGHLLGTFRKGHGIGKRRRGIGLVTGMELAHR